MKETFSAGERNLGGNGRLCEAQVNESKERPMAKIVYRIVKHEDGWAYKARGTFSETFPTHAAALAAAKTAAAEQRVPGETVGIEYETADGVWHEELDPGSDRPETAVEDDEE